jgi:hypothetical protein
MAVMGIALKKPAADTWPMDSWGWPVAAFFSTVVYDVTSCLPRS